MAQEPAVDYSFLAGLGMVEPAASHGTQSFSEGSKFSMFHSFSTREGGIAEFDDQSWELLVDMSGFLQAERS